MLKQLKPFATIMLTAYTFILHMFKFRDFYVSSLTQTLFGYQHPFDTAGLCFCFVSLLLFLFLLTSSR